MVMYETATPNPPPQEVPLTITGPLGIEITLGVSLAALGVAARWALTSGWRAGLRLTRELTHSHTLAVELRAKLANVAGALGCDRVAYFGVSNSEVLVDQTHVFRLRLRGSWEADGLTPAVTAYSTILDPDNFPELVQSPLFSGSEPWEGWGKDLGLDWVNAKAGTCRSYWALVRSHQGLKGVLLLGWRSCEFSLSELDTLEIRALCDELGRIR